MVGRSWKPPLPLNGHIFCLDENTEIYFFDNKLKNSKIKNLPKKFRVVSYNFKKMKKEIKDAEKFYVGEQECYEIILENNKRIIATGNHKFFNENLKEMKVKNLRVGNKLVGFNSISGNIGLSKKDGNYNQRMGFNKKHIPWHKNKNKEDFPQLKRKGNKNYVGWAKGLTKDDHPSLEIISQKAKKQEARHSSQA